MALAHDASFYGTATGASFTCSGTNRLLIADIVTFESGSSDVITGATYNSVAMTRLVSVPVSTTYRQNIYYLINPAEGENTFAYTASDGSGSNSRFALMSYSGAYQTSFPNASDSTTGTTGSTISRSVTPDVAGCWVASFAVSWGGTNPSANTGVTERIAYDVGAGGDSNAIVTVNEAYTQTWNLGSPSLSSMVIMAIAPAPEIGGPKIMWFI